VWAAMADAAQSLSGRYQARRNRRVAGAPSGRNNPDAWQKEGNLAWKVATDGRVGSSPASEVDCQQVLDRIVELELREQGYRDTVLRTGWQRELEHRFAPDLKRCCGLEVRNDLRACLETARSSEEITHRCFK
jgi:hypothetical protein